jgi:3-phosphoshikimate 1-carboxyvinyltransferase
MCFSLAAFHQLSTLSPSNEAVVRILEPRCVGKTFPEYFEALFAISKTPPQFIPVMTIDGPTASGKGTLASLVANALGYHFLDSGALYRATAWVALKTNIAAHDISGLTKAATQLNLRFDQHWVWLDGEEVSHCLRQEHVATMASKISVHEPVRQALLNSQLSYQRLPGLVADGRDMGTVVFPKAHLKVFITAKTEVRAQRRYEQLPETCEIKIAKSHL